MDQALGVVTCHQIAQSSLVTVLCTRLILAQFEFWPGLVGYFIFFRPIDFALESAWCFLIGCL